MKRVPYSLYLLPARGPKDRPRKSGWKMSPAQAAALGALSPIAGTTEYRDLPETPEELARAGTGHASAGWDGIKSPTA